MKTPGKGTVSLLDELIAFLCAVAQRPVDVEHPASRGAAMAKRIAAKTALGERAMEANAAVSMLPPFASCVCLCGEDKAFALSVCGQMLLLLALCVFAVFVAKTLPLPCVFAAVFVAKHRL